MKLFSVLLLLLFVLLTGCTAATSEFDAAAFRHKLDAWKPAGAAAGLAEPTRADDSASGTRHSLEDTGGQVASATRLSAAVHSPVESTDSPPVRGPMLNAIVDRVMEHVASVTANAKVNFKNGAYLSDATGDITTARPANADPADAQGATPTARRGRADAGADLPTQSRGQGTPPPPAEQLAATAGVLQDVPIGWTGALIYSQPGCRPCEREIAAIRDSGGWTVGYGAAGFRSKAHFVVIVLTRDSEFSARGLFGTPTTVYFRGGREVGKRILEFAGTDAELIAILAAHPKVNRATVPAALGTGPAALGSACPCATGGVCTCVDGCRCGAACRCVNCQAPNRAGAIDSGRPVVASPLYYDGTPVYYDATPAFAGSHAVFVPSYSSPSSYYVGGAVAVPSQVGIGVSAFGTPLFGASIGSCGPGGCHP